MSGHTIQVENEHHEDASEIKVVSEVVTTKVMPPPPTTTFNDIITNDEGTNNNNNDMYQYLVLDSGPIIKRFFSNTSSTTNTATTTMTRIWEKARYIYTVPAVINEIRDANARQYLQSLPFDIILQEPKSSSIQQIISFAKLTGDYHSLSYTDIQVLALLYDLEVIGCHGSISHIRTTPKRKLGLGKIQTLNNINNDINNDRNETTKSTTEHNNGNPQIVENGPHNTVLVDDTTPLTVANEQNRTVVLEDYDIEEEEEEDHEEDHEYLEEEGDDSNMEHHASSMNVNHVTDNDGALTTTADNDITPLSLTIPKPPPQKSWASLVRPTPSTNGTTAMTATATTNHVASSTTNNNNTAIRTRITMVTEMKSPLVLQNNNNISSDIGGQFSDASEDGDESDWSDDDDDDGGGSGDIHNDIPGQHKQTANLKRELQSSFPSLAAAQLVPYVEENRFGAETMDDRMIDNVTERLAAEERKVKSLQPISKSGKLYNSFTKYKDLMKPKAIVPSSLINASLAVQDEPVTPIPNAATDLYTDENNATNYSSRIIGSSGNGGQMGDDFEDDGEGWITTTKDISKMKAAGVLDPSRTVNDVNHASNNLALNNIKNNGPMLCQRAACVTTDFAMQNVILQMNLELLSLDGIRVRKLKNWVTRCGACYTVYTNTDTNNVVGPLGKRLFCEKCGSDVMQRIAASVDGKTGRLRLHLSKKYQYNLRGTKFSLPKPGSGNRFQGDLLLREDQLLMGAWNQKLKMVSGGKARDAAQSIFGRDIATNVGCHASAVNMDDIRVGFGRRNPNAVKGRERRGKKKKSVNTACGLRRY